MATTTLKVDYRDRIEKWLKDNKRSVLWLAEESGISYNTLHPCLKRRLFTLSEVNLKKIIKATGTDFK